jgi:hypothetical protein
MRFRSMGLRSMRGGRGGLLTWRSGRSGRGGFLAWSGGWLVRLRSVRLGGVRLRSVRLGRMRFRNMGLRGMRSGRGGLLTWRSGRSGRGGFLAWSSGWLVRLRSVRLQSVSLRSVRLQSVRLRSVRLGHMRFRSMGLRVMRSGRGGLLAWSRGWSGRGGLLTWRRRWSGRGGLLAWSGGWLVRLRGMRFRSMGLRVMRSGRGGLLARSGGWRGRGGLITWSCSWLVRGSVLTTSGSLITRLGRLGVVIRDIPIGSTVLNHTGESSAARQQAEKEGWLHLERLFLYCITIDWPLGNPSVEWCSERGERNESLPQNTTLSALAKARNSIRKSRRSVDTGRPEQLSSVEYALAHGVDCPCHGATVFGRLHRGRQFQKHFDLVDSLVD